MSERVSKWQPVSDVDGPFERIAYSFEEDTLSVRMVGARTLVLRFLGVVALRFEQDCPGVDFLPLPQPTLGPSQTFPLLVVDQSRWLEPFQLVYRDLSHFALVSSDHLMQVIAKASVKAHWETPA